jgi:hypothetical protein
MPLSSYPLHCSTLHAAATASTAQQPSLRPPLPSTTSVPSSSSKIPVPQWSVCPQLAASCRLPPTSFYNACAQHQVVSVSPGCCLHQPASHLIILAHHCPLQYLPKWSVCPLSNLVSANCLCLQIHHLRIAPFRSTNTWCGLLAYTYRIVTWGSHYSTICPPGLCAHYHLVSANCLRLQNCHLGIALFRCRPSGYLVRAPTITWSQLITYAYIIVTWGSHYSDVDCQATWSMRPPCLSLHQPCSSH